MKIKESLDILFKDVEFDEELIKKIIRMNVGFITANQEIRDMMGSKLTGCFHVSYTQINKDYFYQDLFGFTFDDAVVAIKRITTIPKNFAVARDDINLITYYIAHRFLSNKNLKKDLQKEGATEILIYFGYRTVVLLNANYWKYPITRAKAVSLSESLSRNYLITNLKNWNQYVHYRTEQYLESKQVPLITKLDRDRDVPNSIVDLYGRYKDTFKNIYSEFVKLEDKNIIKSNGNIISDLEGQEVLMDRLHDPVKYSDKVIDNLKSTDDFIKQELIEISCSIVTAVSQDQLSECLKFLLKFYYKSIINGQAVTGFIEDFIADSLGYLQDRKMFLNNGTNVIEVVSLIVGNVLYSRGTKISITKVKNRGEELMKEVYDSEGVVISSRNLTAIRNVFCIYILIMGLT